MSNRPNVDVLIVGGGLAGLMAAVSAAQAGAKQVLLVDKCEVGKSGASVQAKRLAAVGEWSFREDTEDKHYLDTLASGQGLCNAKLVRKLADDAQAAVDALEAAGMRFDPKDPSLYAKANQKWVGHSHYRLLQCGDSTGKVLLDVLRREAYRSGVEIWNGFYVSDLWVENSVVLGVTGLDFATGQVHTVPASATILATGGAGYLYARTSNPPQMTGDGLWLAYQAGAELIDMEMVQFYPVNYIYPQALEGKNAGSYAEAKLFNAHQERFMKRYDSFALENTTRDKLAQAIHKELLAGNGTKNGGVYMDRTNLGDDYYTLFPVEVKTCLEGGLDLRTEVGEVSPASHYTMGGVRIGERCETSITGLYAAGEVAAGVHGANRLADNSLTETLVFGRIAGAAAAKTADDASQRLSLSSLAPTQQVEARLQGLLDKALGNRNPHQIRESLRKRMTTEVGVVRSESSLVSAIDYLLAEQHSIPSCLQLSSRSLRANPEFLAVTEIIRMLDVGYLIAMAALYRTESRGAHFREDFPESADDKWLTNVVIRKGNQGVEISTDSPD